MPPHSDHPQPTRYLANKTRDDENDGPSIEPNNNGSKEYKVQIVWRNIALMTILHTSAIYGLYLYLFSCKLQTIFAVYGFALFSGMGITVGAHRYWTHRSFKANLPLRIIMMIMNTMALQNDIYEWSRDHRVHHKYSETDADPHNANRGFFFAHVGWLLCKKHPDVLKKGKSVDLSDIWNDSVVRFQRRFYMPMISLFCFFLPAYIPYYFWGEDFMTAFFTCSMLRYCAILHVTWLVNSAAHLSGNHIYDETISPAENFGVTLATFGEGYHNFHHVFPYDYSTSEFGWSQNWNFSTFFIECFEKIGWAWDLKKVPKEVVLQRQQRTGEKLDDHIINKEKHTLRMWIKVAYIVTSGMWVPLLTRAIFLGLSTVIQMIK